MQIFKAWLIELHLGIRSQKLLGPLIFIVLTVPWAFSPIGGVFFEVVKYSFLFIGMGLLLWSYSRSVQVSKYVFWGITLFVVLFCLSALLALDPVPALLGFYPRYNNFALLYVLLGLILIATASLERKYQTKLLEISLVSAFVVAVFGILQSQGFGYYGGMRSLLALTPDRVPGLLGNPNFSSLYVAMSLPLLVHLALTLKGWKQQLLCWGLVVVSGWSLAVYSSRGAILGTFIFVLVYIAYLFYRKLWVKVLVGVFMLLGVTILFFGTFSQYRGMEGVSVYTGQDYSAVNRYLAWETAGRAIAEKPWFGVGAGSFQTFFWTHWPEAGKNQQMYFDDPHNLLLFLPATLGIPLSVLIFGFFAFLSFRVIKVACKATEPQLVALLSGLGIFFFGALFNPVMMSNWLVVAVFSGLLLSRVVKLPEAQVMKPDSTILLKVLAVVFIIFGIVILISDHLVVRSEAKLNSAHYSEASRLVWWAKKLNPLSTQAHFLSALVNLRQGEELGGFEANIEKALNLQPLSPYTQLTCALLYSEAFQSFEEPVYLDEAEKCYKKTFELSPGSPNFEIQYGAFLMLFSRYSEAEGYIKRGLAGGLGSEGEWILLAKWYQEAGQALPMIFALEKAYDARPTFLVLKDMANEIRKTGDVNSVQLISGMENPLKYYR